MDPLNLFGPHVQNVILDTNTLIATNANLDGLAGKISSLSYGELYFGIYKQLEPEERMRRQTRLSEVEAQYGPGIPFTDEIARIYGDLCGRQLIAGRNPRSRQADLMIAATALWFGVPLVTRNPRDFHQLGLAIIEDR